ncbi:hypothetical protein RND81_07G065200 [Saponaria officinalis]|uniref:Reverse transcriptase domain-containing protein n=1 Tax=Saponaria officinalis TaxID=3572 RepID=A0AAW1JPL5_SAPOF
MTRPRGRPPKTRPPGASSSLSGSIDTTLDTITTDSSKTHESEPRSPIVLGDFLGNLTGNLINSGERGSEQLVHVNSGDTNLHPISSGEKGISGAGVVSSPVTTQTAVGAQPILHNGGGRRSEQMVPSNLGDATMVIASSGEMGDSDAGVITSTAPTLSATGAQPILNAPKWSEVAKSNEKAGMTLFFHEESCKSEEIDIELADVEDEIKLWQFTLMGNIIGAKSSLKQVSDFVSKYWGHIASPIVQYYRMNSVLKEGPWRIGSNTLVLKKWSPTFSVEMEKVTTVPVWVLFPGLDPYLCKVGKPLFADLTTTLKHRLSFARVMVEVDVSKPLVEHVFVNSPFVGFFSQPVEYEWWNKKKAVVQQADVPVPGPVSSEGPPLIGAPDSGCQLLGGTSDPTKATTPLSKGKDLECDKLGLESLSQVEGVPVLESVKHSECAELGPPSLQMKEPFTLIQASSRKISSAPVLAANPLVASNSFDVLSLMCANFEGGLGLVEVCDFLRTNMLDVFSVLETRVKERKALRLAETKLKSYGFIHNYNFHKNGRIWVLWDPRTVSVVPLDVQAQHIHCVVTHHGSDVSERISDAPTNLTDILDFNSCILGCSLDDLHSSGCAFTWTNNQDGNARVWSKLDRALVNSAWLCSYPSSSGHFLPSDVSDHSPCMVTVLASIPHRRRFSFLNCWVSSPGYLVCIRSAWDGFMEVQADPLNATLLQQVHYQLALYNKLRKVELSILRQKAKVDNTLYSDYSTKFFYARIKERQQSQIIGSITNQAGHIRQGVDDVACGFIDYYKSLLGSATIVSALDISVIRAGTCLSSEDWPSLVGPILDSEISAALSSIKPDKSPGPDGFSSAFFSSAWDIVGADFRDCVRSFFRTGHMAKQANSTLLTLIPKKKVSLSVTDFRPISCCTVLYKVISKIIVNRLQRFMPCLVGKEHTAFIMGRSIFDNIMLSQSLIKSYDQKFLTPRCLIKVDIRKAFDSLQWEFIRNMLIALNFPPPPPPPPFSFNGFWVVSRALGFL